MKTKIRHREGQIRLVAVEPNKKGWESDALAEMTLLEGTGCWRLIDVRLKEHIVLSQFGCGISAESYYAHYEPRSPEEAELIKGHLREYGVQEDGSIYWCSFDGIVRGQMEVGGYRPDDHTPWKSSAGYFSRDEALARLKDIQEFWEGFDGKPMDAKINNVHRQPSHLQMWFIVRQWQIDQRVAALPLLEDKAGAAYTLWEVATEAMKVAAQSNKAISWSRVEREVIAQSVFGNGQDIAKVAEVLRQYSPGRSGAPFDVAEIEQVITQLLGEDVGNEGNRADQGSSLMVR